MSIKTNIDHFTIRFAEKHDIPFILSLIKELADYEKLSDEVTATEKQLADSLFGQQSFAEVLIGEYQNQAVSFALFFHNYSTFLAKPGLYLEDLFVRQQYRGKGFGKAMLSQLALIAKQRDCGRLEWSVLDWNDPAIKFYQSLNAIAMDEWTGFRLSGQALNDLALQL